MPPSSLCSTRTLPVDWQNAVTSGTEPGSVDSTSSWAPIGSSDSALRVFRIGSGQVKPLVSSVLSGMRGSGGQLRLRLYQRTEGAGNDPAGAAAPHRLARAPAAGHDADSRLV